MVKYQKDETNTVIVTLTEGVTISNPFFLLALTSKATKEVVKTFVSDLSSYPERYNKFSVSLDLAEGDYIYNFYQKENEDNEDIDGALLLETGLWRVWDIKATIKYYEPS